MEKDLENSRNTFIQKYEKKMKQLKEKIGMIKKELSSDPGPVAYGFQNFPTSKAHEITSTLNRYVQKYNEKITPLKDKIVYVDESAFEENLLPIDPIEMMGLSAIMSDDTSFNIRLEIKGALENQKNGNIYLKKNIIK